MSRGRARKSRGLRMTSRHRCPLTSPATSHTASVPASTQAKKKCTTRPVARSWKDGIVAQAGKPRNAGRSGGPLMANSPVVSNFCPNTVVKPRGPSGVFSARILRMALSYSKPDSWPT